MHVLKFSDVLELHSPKEFLEIHVESKIIAAQTKNFTTTSIPLKDFISFQATSATLKQRTRLRVYMRFPFPASTGLGSR